jgi:hypothetical protein
MPPRPRRRARVRHESDEGVRRQPRQPRREKLQRVCRQARQELRRRTGVNLIKLFSNW